MSAQETSTKEYDVLVYGATGFTGKRVAKEIARIQPKLSRPFRWAIAGRDRAKLEETLKWLAIPSSIPQPAILVADISDPAKLQKVISLCRVVINCVGPFRFYGIPVVKACVEGGADYVDITGEPEFVERVFLEFDDKCKTQGLSIVPCCGFDSVPADLGALYTKQQFHRLGYTASVIEMYINIVTGRSGGAGNFATYESAVHGVANANELRKIRKQIRRPNFPTIGPKLKLLSGAKFDSFIHKWIIPFIGADASVVRMGQQLSEGLRSSSYARPVHSLHPVQFGAYFGLKSAVSLVGITLFGAFLGVLSKYKFGRYLLLRFPGFFSFGFFTKKGPTEAQMRETSFVSTFRGVGYKSLIKSGEAQGVQLGKPEYEIVTRVAGPEPGYVATPIAVVASAYTILEDRDKKQRDVPPGVLTPASAFAATDLIARLDSQGIKFSVVSTKDFGRDTHQKPASVENAHKKTVQGTKGNLDQFPSHKARPRSIPSTVTERPLFLDPKHRFFESRKTMSAHKERKIDDATVAFLADARLDDVRIVEAIDIERKDIEFKHLHIERLNNFMTDELYIDRANDLEASFLVNLHDAEYQQLLERQAVETEEQSAIESDRKTFVNIMNEMKDLKLECLQERIARLETRQERERRSLAEVHNRHLKDLKLTRNLTLRDIEDPELRIIVQGQEFNSMTLAAENAKVNAQKSEDTRVFNAKMFSLLVRNTKEIEQLRELHLLNLKHVTKYCDTELETLDEYETLLAKHLAEEQKLEAQLNATADKAENDLHTEMVAAKVKIEQQKVAKDASEKRDLLRAEARSTLREQKAEARERQRQFWLDEENLLREHLAATGQSTDDESFALKAAALLDRTRLEFKKAFGKDVFDLNDEEGLGDDMTRMDFDANESDRQFAREAYKIEDMRKKNGVQIRKVKKHNAKIRENLQKVHARILQDLQKEQDEEMALLKDQQCKEMTALIETQKTSEKVDEDNKVLNDRLNAMLPRFVVESMKNEEVIAHREFKDLVFLTTDLVSFTSLSSESSAVQVISLLNRLYTAMDDVLDSFHDIFKLETIGDAYCIVSGLNSEDRSPKLNAIDIVECAITFVEIVRGLDMSDQIREKLEMRIGIHCGPAVGGVANISQPKFSLFGDTVTTTGLLEQTSRPNCIHVSGPIYELVKDEYEFDFSESITVQTPGSAGVKKVPTFWLIGRKSQGKATGAFKNTDRKGSRGISFSQ
ncbi:hypothetical protein HDU96_006797 [Phlyctochytrium bullatum]|nr:hypothetical protein HDU96_006797 [Phlyctochytrium bullatum]